MIDYIQIKIGVIVAVLQKAPGTAITNPSVPVPCLRGSGCVPCWLLTVLSNPSVSSMRKKMMAKKVEAGMLAMASA